MKSATILVILLCSLAWVQPAEAQQCGLSSLTYIVRDANGRPMEAAWKSVAVMGSAEGAGFWTWGALRLSGSRFQGVMPKELLGAAKDANTLSTSSSGCVFYNGATLNLTMDGKVMELVFHASFKCCATESFLVDGLPFQEGRFAITLTQTGAGQYSFFPAKGWTKK